MVKNVWLELGASRTCRMQESSLQNTLQVNTNALQVVNIDTEQLQVKIAADSTDADRILFIGCTNKPFADNVDMKELLNNFDEKVRSSLTRLRGSDERSTSEYFASPECLVLYS